MTTGKQILICLLATYILARILALGWVISKHGETIKTSKYNAISHSIFTSVNGWILYVLLTD